MQSDFGMVLVIALGIAVIIGVAKAMGKKSGGANVPPPLSTKSATANPIAAQQELLRRISAQSSNREVILEDEPAEIVEALETSMLVSLILLIAHGYRRDRAYHAERRAIMLNLLGREYDKREADITESVFDLRPDGMQIDPFVDEDLIKPSTDWPTARKEQILLGAMIARTFGQHDPNDEWHVKGQAEIDEVLHRVAQGFFGDLAPRLLPSLQADAATRTESVNAALAGADSGAGPQ